MPLPRLPDLSLDTWIRDQQQQFERTISSIGEAFEFKDAVAEIEGSIPPDYPYPGGEDQWREAEQQQQAEEYARIQREQEAAEAQRQQEENTRQYEAYLNEKMRLEEQQRQDQLLQETQAAGLESPDQMSEFFAGVEQNRGGVGEFQQFAGQIEQGAPPDFLMKEPAGALPVPPSPQLAPSSVSQGGSDLEALTAQIEAGQYQPPEPSLEEVTAQIESRQPGPYAQPREARTEPFFPEGSVIGEAVGAVQRGVQKTWEDRGREREGTEWVGHSLGNLIRPLIGQGPLTDQQREAVLDQTSWYPKPVREAIEAASDMGYQTISGGLASNIAGELWTEFAPEAVKTVDIAGFEINPGEFIVPDIVGGGQRSVARHATRAAYGEGVAGAIERGTGRAMQAVGQGIGTGIRAGREALGSAAQAVGRTLEESAQAAPRPAQALGSGVVPELGEAIPPYTRGSTWFSGSRSDFPFFDPEKFDPEGDWGPAAYLTSDADTASIFAAGEGANIRKIGLPRGIRLLNGDKPLDETEAGEAALTDINRVFQDAFGVTPLKESWKGYPYPFEMQYAQLVRAADGDKTFVNGVLSDLGYDGVRWRYEGAEGRIKPAAAIFEPSIAKMRNEFSGTAGGSGFVPSVRGPAVNAAQGALIGQVGEAEEARREGREFDSLKGLQKSAAGAGLAMVAGSRGARRALGQGLQTLGSGVVPEGSKRDALEAGAQAVRQMIQQGMDDDLVRRAEASLVDKYDVTPSAVRALTRVDDMAAAQALDDQMLPDPVYPPSRETAPWEATAADRAEVARQEAEIAGRPPHAGYLAEDVADAERATSATPSDAGLPPNEPPNRPPTTTSPDPEDFDQRHLPGFEPLPEPKPPRPTPAERNQRIVDEMHEAASEVYQHGRERFSLEDIDAQAERIIGLPGTMRELRQQALDTPGDRASIQGRALQMDASAAAEAARRAAAETLSAQRAVDRWKRANGINNIVDEKAREKAMQALPQDLADRVEEAVSAAAILADDFGEAFTGQARRGSMAGRELRSRQTSVMAGRVYRQVERGKAYFNRLTQKAEELAQRGDAMTDKDWKKLQEIQKILDEDQLSDEMIDAVTGSKLGVLETEAAKRVREAKGRAGTRTPKKAEPREETAAEIYGRLARARDGFRNEGDHGTAQAVQRMIDDVIERIKSEADERATKILDQELADPLSPEAGMKAIERAVGNRVVNRYNREALLAQEDREGPAGLVKSMADWRKYGQQMRDQDRLQKAFERRIDQALRTEQNKDIRLELRTMVSESRGLMKMALRNPGEALLEEDFYRHVNDLRHNPGVGKMSGDKLATMLEHRYEYDKAMRLVHGAVKDDVGFLQARLRGAKEELKEVMGNRSAPGAGSRAQEILNDIRSLSVIGKDAADEARERMFRANILEAGKGMSETERSSLISAMATLDMTDPAQIQGVLKAMREPHWWDKFREGSYISMLSNPWTTGTNALSNFFQLAGMVGLQAPGEYVFSGGRVKGQRAALEAAWNAAPEGVRLAKDVMRKGMSEADIDRVNRLGDVGAIRREYLTEQGGWKGALAEKYHQFSTRPLEAMDQLLGSMAYAAKTAEAAQRKADRLLKSGDARFTGMDRVEAKQDILANIWDHMDIIEAGRSSKDEVLLKSRSKNAAETFLRTIAAARDLGPNPSATKLGMSIVMDHFLPFFNVPLNYGKQGFERTLGVPINAVKGTVKLARGDIEGGARDLTKAAVGGTAMMLAANFYANDSLTADGPQDPGQRKIWEETHKPYSFRLGNQWVSYQGTPWAIPFAMIAGAGEAIEQAGRENPAALSDQDRVAAIVYGGALGAVQGFASQSFLQSLSTQLRQTYDEGFKPGAFSQAVAGNLVRYGSGAGVLAGAPTLSGASTFLANMFDTMERDAGRPSTTGEIPENIAARVAMRVPGARNQLSERIGAYGEPVHNARSLYESMGLGVVPYYRGQTERPITDPVTRSLSELGVGRDAAPNELTVKGFKVPLTIPEQREFDKVYGQTYRTILDRIEVSRQKREAETGTRPVFDEAFYTTLRDKAREMAVAKVVGTVIPRDEFKTRLRASVERERAAPRR